MPIKLIAGLGNDEEKYLFTFHNIGFWAVQLFAARLQMHKNTAFKEYLTYRSMVTDLRLITPHGYMNSCGPNIEAALRHHDVQPKELLVVLDDFSLPMEQLRFRRSGSAGGHNGLKSIIESIGTSEFPRLRVGFGPVPEGMDPKDFVLRRQPPKVLSALADKAAEALNTVVQEGLEKAMNVHNAKPPE